MSTVILVGTLLGMKKTPTYQSWKAMIARCNNPKGWGYAQYGAKGIKVCERWHRFGPFLEDMGERPPETSIDRIDNARGYEPGNCRWATRSQQGLNRRKYVITKRTPRKFAPGKSPGRPPKPVHLRATEKVHFRCTLEEKESYRRKSGDKGISAWLKDLADKG